MSKKVGLITYHAGYNYGSVFQTFATFCALKEICNDVTIINYRPFSQKDNYALVRTKMGYKTLVNDLLLLPSFRGRMSRFRKFEAFFKNRYKLTKEFNLPEEMKDVSRDFDVIVSGSDQLFNIRSEDLDNHGWQNMRPYLLSGLDCKKISYASSVNDMSNEELNQIKDDLLDFDFLSSRELCSSERLSAYLGKRVFPVIDPTLLFATQFWLDNFKLSKNNDRYILYFCVNSGIRGGFKRVFDEVSGLKALAQELNCKILVVTPFVSIPFFDKNVINANNLSPDEFLDTLYNATLVVTKSYHGIALSLCLNKNFFYLSDTNTTDIRKMDLLKRVGLEGRAVFKPSDICSSDISINYAPVNEKLDFLRECSWEYLNKALAAVMKDTD